MFSAYKQTRRWAGKALCPAAHLIAPCDIYSSQSVKDAEIYLFTAVIYGQLA